MTDRVAVESCTGQEFISTRYSSREPCIIKGMDIGPCSDLWTADYLSQKCRSEREVKVHVCPQRKMDFINKNFIYRTLPFKEFIKRAQASDQSDYFISPSERYYLRALSDDPRKEPANFAIQYPELSPDVNLPLLFDKERLFSSVLRIGSSDCQLWTHYDVMDNLLVEIRGRKKVVLFPPKDALGLYLVGDKSSILDIETPDLISYPLFSNVTQYHCELVPGDILYIPSLWFHNVTTCDFSIAVNVFWKHLDDQYYDPKDIYGNRDPPQVQRAMQIMDRAMKTLEELPDDLYKDFYAKCLVNRIQQQFFNY